MCCAATLTFSTCTTFAQSLITAETVARGSVVHYIDTTFAAILDTAGVASIKMTEGAPLTKSLLAVAEERIDLTTSPLMLHFLLAKGVGPYKDLGEEEATELAKNVQALYFYVSAHQLVGHYSGSGMHDINDLTGKHVWNGPPRGVALTDGRNFLELITGMKDGEGYHGVQTPWGDLVPTISDRKVDAFTLPETLPSGRIKQILAAGGVTLYDIPSDILNSDVGKAVIDAPGHAPFSVPVDQYKAAYKGSDIAIVTDDDTFDTFSIAFASVVPAGLDEELVYRMTMAHLEGETKMKAGAPFASYSGITYGDVDGVSQGACGFVQIKMHPGAIRAFEETGHTIADCLKP